MVIARVAQDDLPAHVDGIQILEAAEEGEQLEHEGERGCIQLAGHIAIQSDGEFGGQLGQDAIGTWMEVGVRVSGEGDGEGYGSGSGHSEGEGGGLRGRGR